MAKFQFVEMSLVVNDLTFDEARFAGAADRRAVTDVGVQTLVFGQSNEGSCGLAPGSQTGEWESQEASETKSVAEERSGCLSADACAPKWRPSASADVPNGVNRSGFRIERRDRSRQEEFVHIFISHRETPNRCYYCVDIKAWRKRLTAFRRRREGAIR